MCNDPNHCSGCLHEKLLWGPVSPREALVIQSNPRVVAPAVAAIHLAFSSSNKITGHRTVMLDTLCTSPPSMCALFLFLLQPTVKG